MSVQNIVSEITQAPCAEKHFTTRCLSCMVDNLLTKNLDDVDALHAHGFISSDMRRAYQHVWSISATRDKAWDHFKAYPETAEAQQLAGIMTRRLPNPSYC